jgi:hypothetical protein
MRVKALFVIALFVFVNSKCLAQTNYNIDPKWDNYYNNYPSGIEENHNSSDFIRIIKIVNFNPKSSLLKSQDILIRGLYAFDERALNQMNITGDYYSRTRKHDDYYELYNMTYNVITKETWDKYAPYLLPLMDIDGTVSLK